MLIIDQGDVLLKLGVYFEHKLYIGICISTVNPKGFR